MGEQIDHSRLPDNHEENGRVDSWGEIARYLSRSIRTVQRWEVEEGMPIHRHKHSDRDSVYAFKSELGAWQTSRDPEANRLKGVEQNGDPSAETERGQGGDGTNPKFKIQGLRLTSQNSGANGRRGWVAIGLLAVIPLIAAAGLVIANVSPPTLRLLSYAQITHDEHTKFGLATDGDSAYFFEAGPTGGSLCKVPAAGGDQTCTPLDLSWGKVVSVSHDRSKVLLLGEFNLDTLGAAVWVASIAGDQVRQVENASATDAVWAPSHKISFAHFDGIWEVNEDGSSLRQLLKTAEPPQRLGWSQDGERLWYATLNPGNPSPAIWTADADGSGQRQVWVASGPADLTYGGFWPANEAAFAFLTTPYSRPMLRVLRTTPFSIARWHMIDQMPTSASTPFGLPWVSELAPDVSHSRLLALSAAPWSDRVYRLDPGTKRFLTFLDGAPASDIDFSPDGRTLVYVDSYDNSLWRYDLDRRAKTPLIRPPFICSLPRWSPDGQSVALSGMGADRIWRIYRISPQGGTPEAITSGDRDEGAPTWSKDSRSVVFGKVDCAWLGDCGVYHYDLTTHTLEMLPDSKRFRTARWSPDGQYVAALRPSDGSLMLFDWAMRRWRKLHSPAKGDCIAWSHDSQYIYALDAMGHGSFIKRVSIATGASEHVTDLKDLELPPNQGALWFGLDPEGALLVAHATVSNEVFSVSYQAN